MYKSFLFGLVVCHNSSHPSFHTYYIRAKASSDGPKIKKDRFAPIVTSPLNLADLVRVNYDFFESFFTKKKNLRNEDQARHVFVVQQEKNNFQWEKKADFVGQANFSVEQSVVVRKG